MGIMNKKADSDKPLFVGNAYETSTGGLLVKFETDLIDAEKIKSINGKDLCTLYVKEGKTGLYVIQMETREPEGENSKPEPPKKAFGAKK